MSATITVNNQMFIAPGLVTRFGTGNLGTYATNGVAVTPQNIGLGVISYLRIEPVSGYIFNYDQSTQKIIARRETNDGTGGSILAEVPNGFNLSSITFSWTASGI